jgi:hypothetical protein
MRNSGKLSSAATAPATLAPSSIASGTGSPTFLDRIALA